MKKVFWSSEDDGFIAIDSDCPGCSAFGETEAEALAELDDAVEAWISAHSAAQSAPPPPHKPALHDAAMAFVQSRRQ